MSRSAPAKKSRTPAVLAAIERRFNPFSRAHRNDGIDGNWASQFRNDASLNFSVSLQVRISVVVALSVSLLSLCTSFHPSRETLTQKRLRLTLILLDRLKASSLWTVAALQLLTLKFRSRTSLRSSPRNVSIVTVYIPAFFPTQLTVSATRMQQRKQQSKNRKRNCTTVQPAERLPRGQYRTGHQL